MSVLSVMLVKIFLESASRMKNSPPDSVLANPTANLNAMLLSSPYVKLVFSKCLLYNIINLYQFFSLFVNNKPLRANSDSDHCTTAGLASTPKLDGITNPSTTLSTVSLKNVPTIITDTMTTTIHKISNNENNNLRKTGINSRNVTTTTLMRSKNNLVLLTASAALFAINNVFTVTALKEALELTLARFLVFSNLALVPFNTVILINSKSTNTRINRLTTTSPLCECRMYVYTLHSTN